jgi:heptosyltransferase III
MPPDAIDFAKVRRVLVTKLRHHGDVLLATPVLTALKEHAPHVEVDALVYRDTAPMLEGHPALAQLHTIDRAWKEQGLGTQVKNEWHLYKVLRNRRYDGVIHLTNHRRARVLARLPTLQFFAGPDALKLSGSNRRSLVTHVYPMPTGFNQRHQVETNLDALRRLGIQPSMASRKLILVPNSEERAVTAELLLSNGVGEKFVHIHPTSRWMFKCWTLSNMAELIDRIALSDVPIVVTAAPNEPEMQWIRSMLSQVSELARPLLYDFSGQLSLRQLAAVAEKATLFVGVDSAPTHIASAMGTRVVVLFGPSSEIEWGIRDGKGLVVTTNHSCRPCNKDGCGGGKVSECLTQLSVDRVWECVEKMLTHP